MNTEEQIEEIDQEIEKSFEQATNYDLFKQYHENKNGSDRPEFHTYKICGLGYEIFHLLVIQDSNDSTQLRAMKANVTNR